METLGWYRYEGTVDCEGIGREMERAAERMGGTTKWGAGAMGGNDSDCLDAEQFKLVADNLITEAGTCLSLPLIVCLPVHVYSLPLILCLIAALNLHLNYQGIRPILHCVATEILRTNEGVIQGVVTESKSGRQAILAKRVIDSTGDADVAHLAGCPYTVIPVDERMGATQVFNAAGVDKDAFLKHVKENPRTYADWSGSGSDEWRQETTGKEEDLQSPFMDTEFTEAAKRGIISEDEAKEFTGSWSALSDAGEATNLNLVHMAGYDILDVNDLTKLEMESRGKVVKALDALKGVVPGFEKAKLRNIGMTIGTRDSRKIVGRHNLTEEEVKGQLRCEDAIGVFPEFIDGYNILILPTTGRYFQVPYGCLVPQDIDNLLVAGRCVAGDKYSHAAMRNMMACTVSGQGAGVAAAVSIKEGTTTSKVDIKKVQAELQRQGVKIH